MGRKQRREELEAAALAARQMLTSDNIKQLESLLVSLQQAWSEAGEEDGDTAHEVIGELRRRIELVKRKPLEQALRSCRVCHHHTFWLSAERDLEDLGRGRVAVCDGCGAVTTFLATKLREGMGYQRVTVAASDGPFR